MINEILASETKGAPAPVVGMGCTKLSYTDRHPFTVIAVMANGKRCVVQADAYKRTDSNGMGEDQDYTFSPDPEGVTYILRLNKNGRWKMVGCPTGPTFAMGYRCKYHDYSF